MSDCEVKMRRSAICRLLVALTLLIIVAACREPPHPRLRPVNVTRIPEGTLVNEPSDFTVTAQGKIIDKETGELIRDATTVVITVTGSHLFRDTATWEVMFPAMSVAEIAVEAPGYESKSFELKPHYKRNVTI